MASTGEIRPATCPSCSAAPNTCSSPFRRGTMSLDGPATFYPSLSRDNHTAPGRLHGAWRGTFMQASASNKGSSRVASEKQGHRARMRIQLFALLRSGTLPHLCRDDSQVCPMWSPAVSGCIVLPASVSIVEPMATRPPLSTPSARSDLSPTFVGELLASVRSSFSLPLSVSLALGFVREQQGKQQHHEFRVSVF